MSECLADQNEEPPGCWIRRRRMRLGNMRQGKPVGAEVTKGTNRAIRYRFMSALQE